MDSPVSSRGRDPGRDLVDDSLPIRVDRVPEYPIIRCKFGQPISPVFGPFELPDDDIADVIFTQEIQRAR